MNGDWEKRLTQIETKMELNNNHAEQWREKFDTKIDKVFTWLEGLPCKERSSRYDSYDNSLKYLWWAISGAFAVIGFILTLMHNKT